jgi:hypothetical protein
LAFVPPKLNFLGRKWDNIIDENNFKIGEIYIAIVDLQMEYFCFSHAVGLAALYV